MFEFIAGFLLGALIVTALAVSSSVRMDDIDIKRGWSYMGGEKYFLVLDNDKRPAP